MVNAVEEAVRSVLKNPYAAHEAFFGHRHDSETPPFHKELIEKLWAPSKRKAFMLFRGSAKTTRAEEKAVLTRCLRKYHYIIILSSSEPSAQQRLAKVKYELETNDDVAEVFDAGRKPSDIWQSTKIIVDNGDICIEALGSGQSILGKKHIDWRPDYVLIDDVEEMSENCDNVSTPEKREKLSNWFYEAFIPAIPHATIDMIGTMLHEECLIARAVRDPGWDSLTIPLEIIDETGARRSSWPSRYPIEWIEKLKEEYRRAGKQDSFERQYSCRPGAIGSRAFKEDMFVFDEARRRTFEPVYVLYDPARTVGPKSCATGKVVASWINNRILVWEASKAYWQPSEIVTDCFSANEEWQPIAVGIEETGLNQFILEPLRSQQVSRASLLPVRPLNPPRGPGKDNFILRLQPHFAAREVVFCGSRPLFQDCIDQLIGFPYGEKDIINALAYILEIRPGVPIYENFDRQNILDDVEWKPGRSDWFLAVNSDGRTTGGILCATEGSSICCLDDWLFEGDPGQGIGAIFRNACLVCGQRPVVYAPQTHFTKYDAVGLRAAANAAEFTVMKGGDEALGREELRRLMTIERNRIPLFRVDRKASWTVRALSGGYARLPDRKEPLAGAYQVLVQGLEAFTGVFCGGLQFDDEDLNWKEKNGRRYLSAKI
jgi:hypothetical protein